MWKRFASWLGIELSVVSHKERLLSMLGGFLAILGVSIISKAALGEGSPFLVASMGASSVLLFAVPHGAMSQPWPLVGGHLISALVGVSYAKLFPHSVFTIPLAVGSAIGLMYYLRCIHAPGGATALVAVAGEPRIQELGYEWVLNPVMLNIALLFTIAVAFNYFFPWRRYPGARTSTRNKTQVSMEGSITHADLVYALSEVDSLVDVTEHELLHIYDLATRRAASPALAQERIRLGGYYSNGRFGDEWSVRHIVDESRHEDPARDRVIYKVVAGSGRRTSGVTTRSEFANWAKAEVERRESYWHRVNEPAPRSITKT
jgi:CBS domain-containing membrane protein